MAKAKQRDEGESLAPLNLRVPSSLKRRFHVWSIEKGVTMTDCLLHWIHLALDGKLPPPSKPPPPPPAKGRRG